MLSKNLRSRDLEGTFELESHVLPIVVDQQVVGVGADRAQISDLLRVREEEFEAISEALRTTLGVGRLDADQEVLAALKRVGINAAGTGKEHLAPFRDHPAHGALVRRLMHRKSLQSFVRDRGPALLAALSRHGDGRIHAQFDPLGSRTGRFTCSQPNLQGLGRSDVERGCITPREDDVFVVGDYAQIDLRVLAHVTRDRRMTATFVEDGDPHSATAQYLTGRSVVSEVERRGAKAINFGVVYGEGAETLARTALLQYGVSLSLQEATRYLEGYRAAYPGVAAWQESIRTRSPAELRSCGHRLLCFAHDDPYPRRLCAPIQATVADGLKLAMIWLRRRLPAGARIVLTAHDEIVVETRRECADDVRQLVDDGMRWGMEQLVTSVPIKVETDVRATWAKGS